MTRIAVISSAAVETPPGAYGGLEAICAYSAEALAKDFDVTLFAAAGSRVSGCDVIETGPVMPGYSGEESAWLSSLAALNEFQIILDHSHFFESYRLRLNDPNRKVLKVFHDVLPARTPPPLGSYTQLAGVSNWHAQFLSENWGVRAIALPNGVPVERFEYEAQRSDYLLFLSRVTPAKGAAEFVSICKTLGVPGIVAGDTSHYHGTPSGYAESLAAAALGANVEIVGTVSESEKARLLSEARAVVVPLSYGYLEAFGLFIIEGLASGAPVFTLDRGAPREIITPETGVVASDPSHLLSAINDLVTAKVSYDAETCRKRALEFGLDRLGDRYRRVITQLQ